MSHHQKRRFYYAFEITLALSNRNSPHGPTFDNKRKILSTIWSELRQNKNEQKKRSESKQLSLPLSLWPLFFLHLVSWRQSTFGLRLLFFLSSIYRNYEINKNKSGCHLNLVRDWHQFCRSKNISRMCCNNKYACAKNEHDYNITITFDPWNESKKV